MAKRWVCYLAALLGCLAFFAAYQGWLAWLILLAVFWLPVLSLAVSLPAILSCRIQCSCRGILRKAEKEPAQIFVRCLFPLPPCRLSMDAVCPQTGQSWQIGQGEDFPTAFAGYYSCRFDQSRVYDYLGLFGFRFRKGERAEVWVRPTPLAMQIPEALRSSSHCLWRPKPGGGPGEDQELRLFHPGDSLSQVHWKLTAKTGKLVVRQNMEALQGAAEVSLELRGDGPWLDRLFGRLAYLGQYLLEREIPFTLLAYTGDGVFRQQIHDSQGLLSCMDRLMTMTPVTHAVSRQRSGGRSCYIGGEPDEG